MTDVKICGLKEARHVEAAAKAGARYVGFNFVQRSPRYVDVDLARQLAIDVPAGICKVALTVDATDAEWDAIVEAVPLDMLQLHGSETPDRVAAVKARYGLPVMKVVGVADESDLAAIDEYSRVADQILCDSKPPKSGDMPGGTGVNFDWRLLDGRRWAVPWMLAGGLTAANVREAVRLTGATQVDLSSGVESAPGVKDSAMIRAFMQAALGT